MISLSKFSKLQIVLVVWAIFAALYIAYDVYLGIRFGLMAQSYQSGQSDTVAKLITEVTKECKPVPVNLGENKVDIINVACLQSASTPITPSPTTPPSGAPLSPSPAKK